MELMFKAKLSVYSIVLTIFINVALICVSFILLFRPDLLKNMNDNLFFRYGIAVFIIFTLITVYLTHPVKYTINQLGLEIKKPLSSKLIKFNTIESINEIKYEDLALRVRLFASGGVWGFFGLFRSSKYGLVNMQSSNFNNLILIKVKNKIVIVISPENKSEFMRNFAFQHNNF